MDQYKQLVDKSPIRVLDEALRSHYGVGRLIMLSGRKGLGKTSILTQIAIDRLLKDEEIIHVSFASRVDHILSWYDHLIDQLADKADIHASDLRDYILRKRILLNFAQETVSIEKLVKNIEEIKTTILPKAKTLFIEGYSYAKGDITELARLKKSSFEVWMTANIENSADQNIIKPYQSVIDSHLLLEEGTEGLTLRLQQEEKPLNLLFDPVTLLLKNKK